MNKLKLGGIIAGAVILVIVMFVFIVQGSQNKAISLEEQINTAQSTIDVQEKRRVDLLCNLVDCVKQYDSYESKTLEDVISKRSSGSGDIENASVAIAAVSEAYPDLKSNQNYKNLMTELSVTENLISASRDNYNAQVKSYNRCTRTFPNRMFLNITGYEILSYDYLDYSAPVDSPKNLFKED